ncbi:hypothetical protein [uncultured Cohaesibacter sp.]|uniref:hypothetical protein n=1 Tax=uncultured Cohaesibacter sp. TaxID=1002546 RepID=UPI0029C66C1F|nr:hypothetical protein [uncultured Cohaesibacter sp.]
MSLSDNEPKQAWESKINWTQIVAVLAMGLTMFGIDLDPDIQQRLAVTISSLAAAITIIWRTWYTSKKIV